MIDRFGALAFEPLYRTAPAAALRNPIFYELLALVDAIRMGEHVNVRLQKKS